MANLNSEREITAVEGMTWAEWLDSDYCREYCASTGNSFSVVGNELCVTAQSSRIYNVTKHNIQISVTQEIEAGAYYMFEPSPIRPGDGPIIGGDDPIIVGPIIQL